MSNKYRRLAKMQPCMVRLPVCNGDPATSVLAHKNGSGGIALKSPDFLGAIACSSCHAVVDGVDRRDPELLLHFYEAIMRTQLYFIEHEMIEIKVR